DVLVEFQDDWGFPLWEDSKDTPWARDMDRIFGNLSVVDNWDATTWLTVSASNGALGVGLGLPRVAWAPDLGPIPPDIIPPVSIDTMTGTPGLGGWYVSPVTVKVKARDIGGSGVNVTHLRTERLGRTARPSASRAPGTTGSITSRPTRPGTKRCCTRS